MMGRWRSPSTALTSALLLSVAASGALGHHEGMHPKQKMEKFGVVPDVLDVSPPDSVEVDYGNGADLHLGNQLTPTQVKERPLSVSWPTEKGALYTLAMVDPDAPSRDNATLGEVKHWLIVNIPGTNLAKGDELAGYRGSGPPKGTGLHRYVFVVYRQPGELRVPGKRVPSSSREDRYRWSLRKFATKYNLGAPVAGNFFLAKWDEYVDTIPK